MNAKQRRKAARKALQAATRRHYQKLVAHQEEANRLNEAPDASPLPVPGVSPLDEQRAVDAVNARDNFAALRGFVAEIAQANGDWAGIPLPIQGTQLVVEPKFSKAKELAAIFKEPDPPHELDDAKIRSTFYSHKLRCDVVIYEHQGKIDWRVFPAVHGFMHSLHTIEASVAWGIEQEHRALNLLGTLIRHHQMKYYLLTGMFIERSKRSGLTYCFRKLRPTVVLSPNKHADEMMILCTLCMHPIAYYGGSWAGAMCPTDDVIAHLMLMRGDEPMLWRRANQHAAHRPESGL